MVVGGGNKALFLAMYLTKYAGMSVGIFEQRHEIGAFADLDPLGLKRPAQPSWAKAVPNHFG